MTTIGEALQDAARRLGAAKIESARLDARVLLAQAMNLRPEDVFGREERFVSADAVARFHSMISQRENRVPVSRILGRREFWSLEFELGPDTLDPRPDSETLVDAALQTHPNPEDAFRLLDLGTGTGCLLLAILSERPSATGLGVDAVEGCIEVARRNADRLAFADRAKFQLGDWGVGLEQQFDLIVSNPPYIADHEIAKLEPEVSRHDPRRALTGGTDGLDAYQALATDLPRLLAPGGIAILEIGYNQAGDVTEILRRAGLSVSSIKTDLAGQDRCLITKPQKL